ncbi:methionine--tRNA ligase, cytoplasmic isoform X2 [Cimex lectularius]|uniref:Methionine--tRNA ligase, cytoplasmic n=1 Tax=Cimex lectularius TaxID=79782 RepID=A0A8I6TKA8_CIMLE|nr:methionine--tRNA ligase, cytoplasmic isoform X2 [Cimex lectularius]
MKLYSNPGNPHALKILACANLAGQEVEVELVPITDKRFQCPKKLPVLELPSGYSIFSSNVACSYLFRPPKKLEVATTEWLTWDTVKLQPLIPFIGTKTEPTDKIEFVLTELNNTLNIKQYLVSDQLTSADICVCFTLYPLLFDEKLGKQFLLNRQNILKWSKHVLTLDQVKSASKKFEVKSGEEALLSVTNSSWFPSPTSENIVLPDFDSDEHEQEVVLSQNHILQATKSWESGLDTRSNLVLPSQPVLPVKDKKNVLITSALPYVNNVPHLGNIIGCVLSADVFARYSRFRGHNTFFVCGTDEYGTATETKALEEGLTPQQICDKYFEIHDNVYKWFNISFDYFGRTTTAEQKEVVHEMFKSCYNNGYTSTSSVDQLLCENCNRYLADRFVEGICPDCKYEDARGDQCDGCGHLINAVELIDPKCKLCKNTPVIKQSKQIFIELPKVEEKLKKWVAETSKGWSHNARVITEAWLKGGLKPRCITRDLKWGVPVPLEGFEQKVFYVWFDAPIGYMSMTKRYTDKWLKWWQPSSTEKVVLYQFMAKDNVPFHSIMFPATLMASNGNYTIVNHLMATEYLNYENGKFSKSRGIGVFGNDAKDTGIPSDIFRFYLLYIRPESQDTNFSWADLALKNNTELLNNLGNFIMRTLSFVDKCYNSIIPLIKLKTEEQELLGNISLELNSYVRSMDKSKFRDGIKYILNISRHGNQYMQNTKPWVLIKGSESDKEKSATAVALLSNVVCLIASLLQPFMPETVQTIATQVNLPVEMFTITDTFYPYLKTGHVIGKVSPLFQKIEQDFMENLKAKYAGKQNSPSPTFVTVPSVVVDSTVMDRAKAVASLEEAVAKQGDLVRSMKAAGKSKDELKPMINTLLDLKKQLAALKENVGQDKMGSQVTNESDRVTEPAKINDVATLEELIAKQGDLVRAMKAASKSKEEVKPQIDKLLDLKKQLALLKGEPEESKKLKNGPVAKTQQSISGKKKNKKK